ncbi:MAG: hypothetical protein ACYDCQ_18730 [Dehalococcoidia bacterium]
MIETPPNTRDLRRQTYGTAAVYLAGAAIYVALVEAAGAPFAITPLTFGVIMLLAGVFRRRLLASGVLLCAWGTGVLLLDRGVVPSDRSAAVFIIAFGAGALVLSLLRRSFDVSVSLESAALIMLVGGLGLYLSFSIDAFGHAWPWGVALAANAGGLVLAAELRLRRAVHD